MFNRGMLNANVDDQRVAGYGMEILCLVAVVADAGFFRGRQKPSVNFLINFHSLGILSKRFKMRGPQVELYAIRMLAQAVMAYLASIIARASAQAFVELISVQARPSLIVNDIYRLKTLCGAVVRLRLRASETARKFGARKTGRSEHPIRCSLKTGNRHLTHAVFGC